MHREQKILKVAVLVFLSGWIFLPLTGCGVDKSIPKASVLSSGRITLSWNEIPGATAYNIYMSTSPGVTRLNSYRIPFASTPINITDLEPGTTYYFMVTVLNDLGESRTSREIAYTVTNAQGVVDFGDLLEKSGPDDKFLKSGAAAVAPSPAAKKVIKEPEPQSKVTQKPSQSAKDRAPGTQDVTIAWDKVDNATSYNIYLSDKRGVTKKKWIKCDNITKSTYILNGNTYILKGLKKGKTYYVVVTSVRDVDTSVRDDCKFSVIDGCKSSVNERCESKESKELTIPVGQ